MKSKIVTFAALSLASAHTFALIPITPAPPGDPVQGGDPIDRGAPIDIPPVPIDPVTPIDGDPGGYLGAVPELDGGMAFVAVALIAGIVALIRERRRTQ